MLPDFKLETFFSKWEFNAKYHMCASDMETLTITQLLELASNEDREKWNNLPLKYIETYGMPELRSVYQVRMKRNLKKIYLLLQGLKKESILQCIAYSIKMITQS